MDEKMVDLVVTSSPHIRDSVKVSRIMLDVIIALIPATIAGLYFFGAKHTLGVILVSLISAEVAELLGAWMFRKPISIKDLSAVVTGLLFALVLPPSSPYWMVIVGAFTAIILGKWIFGGIGSNPFNPALVGRAVLVISWPIYMTTWAKPFNPVFGPNAVTTATPLNIVKLHGFSQLLAQFGTRANLYKALFLGNTGGCIGETSALLLLIGGLYLIARGVIDWKIPTAYIVTVFVLSPIFGRDPLFSILAGGLFLGAFFMATDYSSSPITPNGRLWYGISLGFLTVIIRQFGSYPEGVMFSILIVQLFVPFFDKLLPHVYGHRKGVKA
jgi:electron transport complex protein RnfD